MTDQITNKIVSMLDQIQAGVTNVAPQAIELVLKAITYDGISSLINSSVLFLVGCLFAGIGYKLFKLGRKQALKEYGDADMKISFYMSSLFTSGGSLLLVIISIFQLTDYWTYVSIFDPKVYLAHEVIEKVISKGDK